MSRTTAGRPLVEAAMDIPAVAVAFGCSTDTIRRRIAAGEIPAVKLGRVWRIQPEIVREILAGGR